VPLVSKYLILITEDRDFVCVLTIDVFLQEGCGCQFCCDAIGSTARVGGTGNVDFSFNETGLNLTKDIIYLFLNIVMVNNLHSCHKFTGKLHVSLNILCLPRDAYTDFQMP
jgi:hypothetical protein